MLDPATIPLPTVLMDGDPILRQRAAEVVDFDFDADLDLELLICQMLGVVNKHHALGLAAPQIGVSQRVIVAHVEGKWHWMVNPRIVRTLRREAVEREGCLSVPPSLWRNVSRPAKCDVAWQDEHGFPNTATLTGLLARVVQHEVEHLDGVLISDKPMVRG